MWKFKRTRAHEYLTGVPARDLTDDEWAALPEDRRAEAEATGLYRHVDDEPATEAERDGRSRAAGRAEKGGER